MINVAILGYGIVGSGVYRHLEENTETLEKLTGQEIRVNRILVRRDFTGDPAEKIMTRDIGEILCDKSISIVVEAIGGVEPAYTYVKSALSSGKSVVTSNKELVAEHGAELLRLSGEFNVRFLFEASVGGGMPIIAPFSRNLSTDRITGVAGILNGTTNFILSEMYESGREYDDALKEAQARGYAESNPSADTDGYDTSRKLAILLSIASGKTVDWNEIPTEGISAITRADFEFCKSLGYTIKLLGVGSPDKDGVKALTAPFLIHRKCPLATANGVYNGIIVNTDRIGPVMFYGKGAGQLPTGAAVVSDIVDAARQPFVKHRTISWDEEKAVIGSLDDLSFRKVMRLHCKTDPSCFIRELWQGAEIFRIVDSGEYALEIPAEAEAVTAKKLGVLQRNRKITMLSILRVYEEEFDC